MVLTAPMFIRGHHHRADQTEAVSNARQIGLALYEFEYEYGAYPNAVTVPNGANLRWIWDGFYGLKFSSYGVVL